MSTGLTAQTPTISPCAQATAIHLVVIGSSTAAGTGPSVPDSAWVNRYRRYLQTINSQNQVTNLAIGGTTTYHIMPNWYIAPNGKPTTNPNNNITQAISLGANAILVNMPSNDAANGFGINEQMANFNTLKSTADSAGIPIWFCTTQPRNGLSSGQIAIQTGVRDSILQQFGSYALDFWTAFANATNTMNPIFDSGDGVHLNDQAHGILNDIVIHADIPNQIADTLSYTDHLILGHYLDNTSICGDSNTVLNIIVGNIGINSSDSILVQIDWYDHLNNSSSQQIISPIPLFGTCVVDTLSVSINSYNGVEFSILSTINSNDSIISNDSSTVLYFKTIGHPSISTINDTICIGDSTTLLATGSPLDTILWYNTPMSDSIIGHGNALSLGNITNNQTVYAQAVRGNLYYDDLLFTSATTTTNWNGIMFDIVANDSLTIDSLNTKLFSTGAQTVIAYYRMGSYHGYENNHTAWTYWDNATINISTSAEFPSLDFSDIRLMPGDTLGIYLHLQNGGANLSYLASATPIHYQNNEVQLLSGAGISHTFGTTYSPRNFSGTVFYHHGFNPLGACATPRVPVQTWISNPTINLGNDTTLHWDQGLILATSDPFAQYSWSDNTTNSQLVVDSSNLVIGNNMVWLSAIDNHGCTATDSISITFSPLSSIITNSNDLETTIQVFPNPSTGFFTIESAFVIDRIDLYTITGAKIEQHQAPHCTTLDLSKYSQGNYLIVCWINGESIIKRLIVH